MSFLLLARILSLNSKDFFLGFCFEEQSWFSRTFNSKSDSNCESMLLGLFPNLPFLIKKSNAFVSDEESSDANNFDWSAPLLSTISQEPDISDVLSDAIIAVSEASTKKVSVLWSSSVWALWLFIKTSKALVLVWLGFSHFSEAFDSLWDFTFSESCPICFSITCLDELDFLMVRASLSLSPLSVDSEAFPSFSSTFLPLFLDPIFAFFLPDFCTCMVFISNALLPSSSKSEPELFKDFKELRTAQVTDHLGFGCFGFTRTSWNDAWCDVAFLDRLDVFVFEVCPSPLLTEHKAWGSWTIAVFDLLTQMLLSEAWQDSLLVFNDISSPDLGFVSCFVFTGWKNALIGPVFLISL